MSPKINPGAYRGQLTCPFSFMTPDGMKDCGSTSQRYVEHITPTRIRYRCRKCGRTYQYDFTNHCQDYNPYVPYRNGTIWSRIMQATQGRPLKGVS